MEFMEFYNNSKKVLTKDTIIGLAVLSMDEKEIIAKNQTQLILGERANGKAMPVYSRNTPDMKAEYGGFISPSGRIALADTFDFFNKFKVIKSADSAEVTSTDYKRDMLVKKYSEDIFGLNEDNSQKVLDMGRAKFELLISKLLFR